MNQMLQKSVWHSQNVPIDVPLVVITFRNENDHIIFNTGKLWIGGIRKSILPAGFPGGRFSTSGIRDQTLSLLAAPISALL